MTIRSKRTKPRPGRLQDAELARLRDECLLRDGHCCVECKQWVTDYAHDMADNKYHMAHIKAKRMGGDSLGNVRSFCGKCHRDSHNAGGKPCPPKPKP